MNLQQVTFSGSLALFEDEDKEPVKLDPMAKAKYLERCAENRRQETKKYIDQYLQDGEYVYELYSIMIHSGGAMGGHYYAYIKNFMTNRWYNFNDSSVKEIDESDIYKVYGGKQSSSTWGSYSANAYLLMYRKVTPDNLPEVDESMVPGHVKFAEEEEKEKVEKEKAENAERWSNLTLKVFFGGADKTIAMKKDNTFAEFQAKIFEEFKITEGLENYRIRGYSNYQDLYQEPYEGEKLEKTLQQLNAYSHKVFCVEQKAAGSEFEEYNPDNYTVKVHVWDADAVAANASVPVDKKVPPLRISINKEKTLRDLMTLIDEKTGIAVDSQYIIKKSLMMNSSAIEIISVEVNYDKKLSYARIFDGTAVYVEAQGEATANESLWEKEIIADSNRYTVKFNHPDDKANGYG
jgi:ubiquitin carboxyl-terminal hydrolase 47